jgi:SsrA-binding protein
MAAPAPVARTVAENRRARHEYFIEDTIQAGLALQGTEVKALREGRANIAESYAAVGPDGLWLVNAHIPEYSHAGTLANHEPRRPRKLLLHAREIDRLSGAAQREGMTLIPLRLYFTPRGIAKLDIAIARGKKLHDRREAIKQRDWDRQKARVMRERG